MPSDFPSAKNAIALFKRTISITLQSKRSIKEVLTTTINSSHRTVNSHKNKTDVSTNIIRAGPPLIELIKTPQGDDLSRNVSNEVGKLVLLMTKKLEEQTPKRDRSETIHMEYKTWMTTIGDVQRCKDLSTTAFETDKTPKWNHSTVRVNNGTSPTPKENNNNKAPYKTYK